MELDKLDDKALVALAQEQHQGAQQLLYRRYFQPIYGYLASQLRNTHNAEDLAQETFVRAFQGLHNYRGEASFKNWLYKIAKNQLADYYRDQHSGVVELDDAAPPRQLQKNMLDETDTEAADKQTMRRLNKMFFYLPAKYKKVLVLRFLKGFSLKETASEMNLSLANTKVIQHRAMKLARTKTEFVYEEN
ncbi:MAG: RNA polymerase sigma factor [Patescibacteria group bacterium]|jgi:RNA polymerase sigma-70 factor (ECF subfamily)